MSLIYVILPVYILANSYVVCRIIHWVKCYEKERFYKVFRIAFSIIYGLMALVMIVAFFLPESDIHKVLQEMANDFDGIFTYLFAMVAVVDIGRIILKKTRFVKEHQLRHKGILSALGVIVFTVTVGASVYGFVHAGHLYTKEYDISIDKSAGDLEELKVVLIADTHIGYSVGTERIADMAKRVNAEKPDVILFAGDIFDNTVEGVDDIDSVRKSLSSLDSKYGIYAVWGNYDIDERLFSGFSVEKKSEVRRSKEMEGFLDECGIITIEDSSVLIEDSFYLVGRKDYSKPGDGVKERKELGALLEGVDMDKPVFLIDHEPRNLEEPAAEGVDVMFSGHTHNGQFFPLNLTCKLIWENSSGVMKKENMYSVVTSGVGVYGPDMRVGTDADITIVNIDLK